MCSDFLKMCSDFGREIFVHSDLGTAKKVIGSLLYVNRTGHVVEARQWLVETYRYVLCHFHGRLWRKKRQKTLKTLEDYSMRTGK